MAEGQAGYLFLFTISLALVLRITADNGPVPILPPEDPSVGNVTINYDSPGGPTVTFNEEMPIPFVVLRVKKVGVDPPNVQNPGLTDLAGFKVVENGEYWTLKVTKRQDYEDPNIAVGYGITLSMPPFQDVYVSFFANNIDDNSPRIASADTACSVKENYEGVFDCVLTFEDPDNVFTDYVIEIQENEQLSKNFDFEETINSNNCSLKLKVIQQLNYEEKNIYPIDAVVRDSNFTIEVSIVVKVIDVPDVPPKWSMINPVYNIPEENPFSVELKAYDGDIEYNSPILFRLGNEEGIDKYFHVKGNILNVDPIDRDTGNDMFTFTVIAYEHPAPANEKQTETPQQFIFIIEDINDNPPKFNLPAITKTIDENSNSLDIPEIVVSDPDDAVNGTYEVELKDLDEEGTKFTEAFSVVPSQGYHDATFSVLIVNPKLLDYEDEAWRHIKMKLVATPKAPPIETAELMLSIDLKNVNDQSPKFNQIQYEVNVTENLPEGTYITTLNATDEDMDDIITYSTSSSSIIQIDPKTGVVKAGKSNSFDYELQHKVIAQVMATDLANHVAYAQLIIGIDDVNDVAPTLYMPPTRIIIMEDREVGTVVPGCDISASDPDTTADLDFQIDYDTSSASKNGVPVSGIFEGFFSISKASSRWRYMEVVSDSVSAELRLEKELHWEQFDSITLNVTVTDKNTKLPDYADRATRSATLTITVKDVNNNAPNISEPENLTVQENSKIGQTIGNIVVTDADFNTTLTYSLTPTKGTHEDWVKIDDNGVLSVGSNDIDCDYNPDVLYYKVTVSDQKHESFINIHIQIEDLNDLAPVVQNDTKLSVPIYENSCPQNFTQIKGTDGDRTEAFRKISYLMDPLYANYWFAIDIDSGWISVNLTNNYTLDREKQDTYTIHISLRDNYQENSDYNTHSTLTYVTLTLLDVNDNAPQFIEAPVTCQADVLEKTEAGTSLFTITAQDLDKEINFTKIDFSIAGITALENAKDPDKDLFQIKTTRIDDHIYKGEVTAGLSLLGYVGKYNVTIEARNSLDELGNPNPVNRTYTICIEDVNDHSPVFKYPPVPNLSFLIYDNQTVGSTMQYYNENTGQPADLPPLAAVDEDYGENAVVFFTLSGDYALQYFKVDSWKNNTGNIILKKPLDIASLEQRIFELQLTASDSATPPLTVPTNLTFKVMTSKPNPPYFVNDSFTMSIEENVKTDINFDGAYDADNLFKPDNQKEKIYYRIVDGDTTHFTIKHHENATISIVKGLDYEEQHSYSVLVTASNNDTEEDTFADSFGYGVLNITVFVIDQNDCPPSFTEKPFVGGIAAGDAINRVIFTLKAKDNDTNEVLTFDILNDTIVANGTLESHKKNGFILNRETGELKLNFEPQQSISGLLNFDVQVTDRVGHKDVAPVQIYVIKDDDREHFEFNNTIQYVDNRTEAIAKILSTYLDYSCHISNLGAKPDSHGNPTDSTVVDTLFMDDLQHVPVKASVIDMYIYKTKVDLKVAFLHEGLHWDDYVGNKATSISSDDGIQATILIAVSAILAVLLFLLLAAFYFKTRRLNRRLEALSATKFGSMDSGLNRDMNVPNTNQHALEGSNPVWNEQIDHDDNSSQGSGDSDLVGIEDSPEFKQQADERTSNGNDEYIGNENFSFAAKPQEPTTEL
ncbi:protocadherin Fat 3-like [Ischnura elegans]|uniref:protocadherin Fat 3-like n=1 Tax=Ischnura elegans TaxID=197161 RepID=UPI001ED8BB76|nr:protocadherin Fat 3-like [Ischnura elegans]